MNNIKGFEEWNQLNESGSNLSYGCVMLSLSHPSWNKITEMIDKEDIYEKDGEFGIEKDPHVTVLYGLHTDIPDTEIEERISKMKAPEIHLESITVFENDEKEYDVVKFDAEGDELHELNKMFTELPHTNDYPEYHPHSTICYVKKGAGKKYIQKLPEAVKIKPAEVIYSKADNTKKRYAIGTR